MTRFFDIYNNKKKECNNCFGTSVGGTDNLFLSPKNIQISGTWFDWQKGLSIRQYVKNWMKAGRESKK